MDDQKINTCENFESFWNASKFTRFNIQEFSKAQDEFNAQMHSDSILLFPSEPYTLKQHSSKMTKITSQRKSQREFSDDALSDLDLATIFSSFNCLGNLEHRTYPSAGGRYGLEIFTILFNCKSMANTMAYYNPDIQALSPLGSAPSWAQAQEYINIETSGNPQCLILFTLFSDRITDKYQERGGRFALIEVGAALQQLSLQIAESKHLKGVAAGGLVDDYWLDVLKLDPDDSKMALGFLCGK